MLNRHWQVCYSAGAQKLTLNSGRELQSPAKFAGKKRT